MKSVVSVNHGVRTQCLAFVGILHYFGGNNLMRIIKDPKTDVRKYFSEISGTYDLLNRVLSLGIDRKWRREAVQVLPHGPETRVLDLAAGTLDLSLTYLNGGPGEIYGVDIAQAMLLQGKTKVSPTLDPRLHLVCADGLQLPFPDHFFDAAMCGYGMRNLPDNHEGLKELKRVLKPNASLLVLEFFRPNKILSKIFSQTYGRFVIPTIGKLISRNNEAYQYLHQSVSDFYTLEEYKQLMEKTGFTVTRAKHLTGGISSFILART